MVTDPIYKLGGKKIKLYYYYSRRTLRQPAAAWRGLQSACVSLKENFPTNYTK